MTLHHHTHSQPALLRSGRPERDHLPRRLLERAHPHLLDAATRERSGQPVDVVGGYYRPDDTLARAVMTPSTTLNTTLANLVG